MNNVVLPSLSSEGSLASYLNQIRKFPMLEKTEEYTLAKAWKERNDIDAAHKLVTSHLRLVAKIAMGYRGYGLPVSDLVSEGNIGLMQAVKRFDPERGFRLATYAIWWIRAAIQEYILHSWSLVKIGTTAAQKKLFFNLRRIKGDLKLINDSSLTPSQVKEISKRLSVAESEIISMNGRISGPDHSLNAPIKTDGNSEWQDLILDESAVNQEEKLVDKQEYKYRKAILVKAITQLNERERFIFSARRLNEKTETLENLSKKYDISRERVRQIEVRAFEKVQQNIKNITSDKNKIDMIDYKD